jgi:hypothetical protein
MKKINVLLMAAIAIILFSCGNGNGTKNETNQDSDATVQNAEEIQGINSFEFMTKISQDKKFTNENLDKTVVITDLLVYSYEPNFINEVDGFTLNAYAYNVNDNKLINRNSSRLVKVFYKGKQIQEISLDEKFKMDAFQIYLKDPKQVKILSFFDATRKFGVQSEEDGNGGYYKKFEELIKVKGTVSFTEYGISLNDAEIIK